MKKIKSMKLSSNMSENLIISNLGNKLSFSIFQMNKIKIQLRIHRQNLYLHKINCKENRIFPISDKRQRISFEIMEKNINLKNVNLKVIDNFDLIDSRRRTCNKQVFGSNYLRCRNRQK